MWTYINVLFCQVFPLDELGAVCGFEAFINGKHIIGEVKEKEKAHKEYQQVGFALFQTHQLAIMAFSHTIHSVCVACIVRHVLRVRCVGQAVSEGHGAYLMDEEKPEVFTVSVGNLPPKCDALIKITYVTELEVRALARQHSSGCAC
mgnify:CR=1 FL=1